jgi:hypothetical protein
VVPRPIPAAPRKHGGGAQAVARGAARCASQVVDCGAQAVAHGAARCASQILDRGAQAVARGARKWLAGLSVLFYKASVRSTP